MQRLRTVTGDTRTSGLRHQSDASSGGRERLRCQLFDVQLTYVPNCSGLRCERLLPYRAMDSNRSTADKRSRPGDEHCLNDGFLAMQTLAAGPNESSNRPEFVPRSSP